LIIVFTLETREIGTRWRWTLSINS